MGSIPTPTSKGDMMNLRWYLWSKWVYKVNMAKKRVRLVMGGVRRFPQDYTQQELAALVTHHHEKHVEAATKLMETRDKLIQAQKELSVYKRGKNDLAKEIIKLQKELKEAQNISWD